MEASEPTLRDVYDRLGILAEQIARVAAGLQEQHAAILGDLRKIGQRLDEEG